MRTWTLFLTHLFLPTPPVSKSDISVKACDTSVSTSFTVRDTRPQSEVGQTSDKGKLAACFGFEDTETDKHANFTPEAQEKSLEENAAKEMGYSLEAIKICVSSITDCTTQRKLRDKPFARL